MARRNKYRVEINIVNLNAFIDIHIKDISNKKNIERKRERERERERERKKEIIKIQLYLCK
jgi:hypothetical protein